MTAPKSPSIPQAHTPSPALMQEALAAFLRASGFSLDQPHLQDTPRRVTDAWLGDLLDGYRLDPKIALTGGFSSDLDSTSPLEPSPSTGMIVVRDIAFHSLCPHHLLPFFGRAHLAYLPSHTLVGFSQIAALVRCLTHRFTLQETATHAIAEALLLHLQARGAACVLTATQLCMNLREPSAAQATVTTTAFLGDFADRPDLQAALLR